jgi:hypothetical protein
MPYIASKFGKRKFGADLYGIGESHGSYIDLDASVSFKMDAQLSLVITAVFSSQASVYFNVVSDLYRNATRLLESAASIPFFPGASLGVQRPLESTVSFQFDCNSDPFLGYPWEPWRPSVPDGPPWIPDVPPSDTWVPIVNPVGLWATGESEAPSDAWISVTKPVGLWIPVGPEKRPNG